MTRTVADAALMLNTITRPDTRDWHALPYDPRDYLAGLDEGIAGARIAWSPGLAQFDVAREVADVVERAARVFSEIGAVVEAVDPSLPDVHAIFRTHWWVGCHNAVRALPADKRALIDPALASVAADGSRIGLTEYLDAVAARALVGATLREFHTRYDFLVTPTVAVAPFTAGRLAPESFGDVGSDWTRWASFSYPFNLTQQPAATVPCGFTPSGLPVGLQIVGAMHDDRGVLRAARALERARPWHSEYARITA
jgi:aspartyl-tRNA(Asn)/glutamyl-tRNA(Gln) amidotransferase subunit A